MPRINWLGWGAGAGVIALAYHSVVWRLVGSEWGRADFDYCWLIPPVMAWLLWERRAELEALPSRPSWTGLCAFAAVFPSGMLPGRGPVLEAGAGGRS